MKKYSIRFFILAIIFLIYSLNNRLLANNTEVVIVNEESSQEAIENKVQVLEGDKQVIEDLDMLADLDLLSDLDFLENLDEMEIIEENNQTGEAPYEK